MPLTFRLKSLLVGDIERLEKEESAAWQIGDVVEVKWPLDLKEIPRGVYQVYLGIGGKTEFLTNMSLFDKNTSNPLQGSHFTNMDQKWSLKDALQGVEGVGFSPPDIIWLACPEAPWPENKMAVEYHSPIQTGRNYNIHLEIYDSYGSSGMEGYMEQRVYLNGQLAFRHDIGSRSPDGQTYGWYPVNLDFEATTTDLNVRVEVAPMKALGPWGWGVASRTRVRNLQVRTR
jgi:hypothetical protein